MGKDGMRQRIRRLDHFEELYGDLFRNEPPYDFKRSIEYCVKNYLDHDERTVVVLYYGLDGDERRSANEISEIVGYNPQKVRKVLNKAMRKLRMPPSGVVLRDGITKCGIHL